MNSKNIHEINTVIVESFNNLLSMKPGDKFKVPHKLSTIVHCYGHDDMEVEVKTTQTITPKSETQGPKIVFTVSVHLASESTNIPSKSVPLPMTPAVANPKAVPSSSSSTSSSSSSSRSTTPPPPVQGPSRGVYSALDLPPNGNPASKETEAALLAAITNKHPLSTEADHGFKAVPATNNNNNNKRKADDVKGKGEATDDDLIVIGDEPPSTNNHQGRNLLKKAKK
jgi:hypothetical protein